MNFFLVVISSLLLIQSSYSTATLDEAFDYQELQQKNFKVDTLLNKQLNHFNSQYQRGKSPKRVAFFFIIAVFNSELFIKYQSHKNFLDNIKSLIFKKQSPAIFNIPPPVLV